MEKFIKKHESKIALEAHAKEIAEKGGGYNIVGKKITYVFPKDSDLPLETRQLVKQGKVTYRGSKYGSEYVTYFNLKVKGKEYLVSHETLLDLSEPNNKIRFDAPYRRGW
jgi:hypothetical protein